MSPDFTSRMIDFYEFLISNTFLLFILFASSLTLHFVVVVYFFSDRVFFLSFFWSAPELFSFFFPVLLLLHMMRSSTFSFYLHELVLSLQPIIDSKLLHATERPTLFIFSKIGKTAERWKGNQRVCEVLHKKIKCSYTHSLYLLLLLKKVK